MNTLFEGAKIIHKYTRKEAIEDGVLIDITRLAHEAGFKFSVAVTAGVFKVLGDTSCQGQDCTGRTWDMLTILRMEAIKAKRDTIYFAPLFQSKEGLTPVEMWAKCGPDDDMKPVITIMLEDED